LRDGVQQFLGQANPCAEGYQSYPTKQTCKVQGVP
jgi:hypothetical protein